MWRWLAFPFYLAIGVALWRRWPFLRDIFSEAGYVGGMIVTALIWPFMLLMLAMMMVCAFVFWLFNNLFRLFRHKR